MKRVAVLALIFLSFPAFGGQVVWAPGGEQPSLTLSLGDGVVKRTLDLPSGAAYLNLTVKKFLLDDARLKLVWKDGGTLWMSQTKKIPDETTDRVVLPPGAQVTLEIATLGGTPVASIKLRRK
jgi:hypothetical protein